MSEPLGNPSDDAIIPRHWSERLSHHLARWIVIPLFAWLVVIVLVFYVFFSSAVVDGRSMTPTLHSGDYLLITRGYKALHRGDVIVTHVDEAGRSVELVKRIIAIPGDTVEIRNDVAIVNGLTEPLRGQYVDPRFAVSRPEFVIPPDLVYVLGDNRPGSEDSRFLGPVPISGIVGRAVMVYAPLPRLGWI
jgi:signal peptidase I